MAAVDDQLADYVAARWPALVRYATLLCGDASQAEELVQGALVRVALRWHRVRDRDNPDAYVRQAIHRGFISFWRQVRRREAPVADPPEPLVADRSEAVTTRVDVRRALLTLPPRQRAVLVLRYLDDLSEAQTAEVLGCSVGTVKSHASRGLDRLRGVLAIGDDDVTLDQGGRR